MIFEHRSYRSFLKDILAERIRKNSSYSLRAMAQNLGLVSSQLSEVMNGKGGLSLTGAVKVAQRLGLKEDEAEYFYSLVQLEAESDPNVREAFLKRANRLRESQARRAIHDLSVDQFRQISDWHHSAILELADLPRFDFTPANVAAALGIPGLEAQVAIERLERLELLVRDEAGKLQRIADDVQVRSPECNAAMRNFYRQMMEKASQALDDQSPDERLSGYETFHFSPEALTEAREAFEKFFAEMIRLSRKYPGKHVFHALVHVFNLTPKLKG